ncbi:hypothetical protein I6G56_32165 [Burkholderia humptydooensis]|uniref:Uncharacterized protein n=2 Tax=Burkholderia humptydooensis TaxID=430531 RepID=A0A7U4P948_9BURK|nr:MULTISPECIES: hypothetical protein [Burkholderia]AJY40637.1 hypothetical protein BW21_3719 [Burkholderia sp. 2002721687]ALX45232.1 hypothetical protein AQ610_22305 [Burkholderia humptydooensis]EIP85679.1 hypothetical protein A33K_17737 [Burkholderia humptydooensis MSMB43]QPS46700.1 hypothetical protein I6G56_32165 [Burkholderia humptydooensis]
MNSMTQDMTRLHQEVTAGHWERQRLLQKLTDSREDLRMEVAQLLRQLHLANADMFSQALDARTAFVTDLVGRVHDLRQSFVADLRGARRAWRG